MHLTEPAVPDAFAFVGWLSVSQPVVVTRIEETLEIETFNTQMLGIHQNDVAKEMIEASLTELVARTVAAMAVTTQRWEAEKAERQEQGARNSD